MLSSRKIRITEFIIDETIIKVGSEYIWLWIAIEDDNREILRIYISNKIKIFVAERFILNLVKRYGEYILFQLIWRWYMVSTTGLQVLETAPSSYPFQI